MSKRLRLGNGKGLLIAGIIVAVSLGAVLIVSTQLHDNADNWYNAQDTLLVNARNAGIIGPDELSERRYQNDMARDWMWAQMYTVKPIATPGIYVGMLLIFLGLVVLATGDQVDEQTKRTLLTIAGVMLLVLFVLFTGSLDISIN